MTPPEPEGRVDGRMVLLFAALAIGALGGGIYYLISTSSSGVPLTP